MVVEFAAVVGGKSRDTEFQFAALTCLKVPIMIDAYTLLHTTCSPLISSLNHSICLLKRLVIFLQQPAQPMLELQ